MARIGVEVAEALAHAHGQGVLHRDIKPSNLLLDMGGHVWVTDFGLAKLEGSDGPTQTGDLVGTLRYMAPERFEGWSDRRSDVYGLGMTLYEMLTLRPAFEAGTRARLIEQVIHDPPPPPRKLDRQVPRDLETIVLKSIAKEPADRYASREAMAEDLENYLADRPIAAQEERADGAGLAVVPAQPGGGENRRHDGACSPRAGRAGRRALVPVEPPAGGIPSRRQPSRTTSFSLHQPRPLRPATGPRSQSAPTQFLRSVRTSVADGNGTISSDSAMSNL